MAIVSSPLLNSFFIKLWSTCLIQSYPVQSSCHAMSSLKELSQRAPSKSCLKEPSKSFLKELSQRAPEELPRRALSKSSLKELPQRALSKSSPPSNLALKELPQRAL
jgi:hypothetical protein